MALPMGRSQGGWNLPAGLPSYSEVWTLKLARSHSANRPFKAKKRASVKIHQPVAHSRRGLPHTVALDQALDT